MKKLIGLLTLSLLLCGEIAIFTGCQSSRLETGGAYAPVGTNGVATVAPDMAFYQADAAYDLAYSTVDAAFKFERDNRLMLWEISPNIKHTLDGIRPQAAQANVYYARAREAYLANPVPSNLTWVQEALAKIQQLAAAATAVLPKK